VLQANIYEQMQRETLEGRELEASVLFRAAQKLKKCARRWEERHTDDFQERLTEALQYNQKLWSYLQVELANPANLLPETLRMNLLQLSKFIDKRTFALFAGSGTADDLLSIAHINEQIGGGLQAGIAQLSRAEEEENALSMMALRNIVG
jgi:flagellar biosynthesis activator protein FlaF